MPAHLRVHRALALPALLVALLATVSFASPSQAQVQPFAPVEQVLATPEPYKVGPVVRMKLKPKPKPDPNRWVLPVHGYRLTGRFGNSGSMWASTHTGLDLAAPTGTPIRAVSRGVVTSVGWAGAYGYRTIVRTPDGTQLWYCHQTTASVRPGQSVAAGSLIGHVGATGNVTGPHLHLEVHPRGSGPVDPLAALQRHGVRA